MQFEVLLSNTGSIKFHQKLGAEQYNIKQDLDTGRIKIELAEREILYQELKNPELTLVRNYKNILPDGKFDLDKLFEWVQGLNATAIRRIEPMREPFESKFTKRKIDIISKAYESMDDKTYEGKSAKLKLISTVNMLMEPKIVEDKKFFKKISTIILFG